MRGPAVVRKLRQLSMLPLRRESIYHLVLKPDGTAPTLLNRLIAADPALALAILRLAPRSVREGRLGIPQIARFANPTTLLELVRQSSGEAIESIDSNVAQLWTHSIAVAHAARELSRSRRYEHPQTAFLAGLLHNLGILALATVASDSVAELLAETPPGSDWLTVEQKRFGATHTNLGNQLAKRWGLPAWLREVLWWHHQSDSSFPKSMENRSLVELVQEADTLVSRSEFALGPAVDPNSWGLPWKNGDPLAACVSRGVRQATLFFRNHPLCDSAEDPSKLVSRAVELAGENIALHADTDWQVRAWTKWTALPPDATPSELTGLVAETFATAFGGLGAICYIRAADGTSAEGTFWSDCSRAVNCSLDRGASAQPHADQVVGQLRQTWQQRPYRVIDLCAGEESLAHVLLWQDEFGPAASELANRMVSKLCTAWLAHATQLTQLEEQLESLTGSLREQSIQAEASLESAKLAALAEMAGGAGHEINNPLAVISGRAQLLMAEESDPRRRKSLETIIAQAQRIHCMIVDLMMFARPPEPDRKHIAITEAIDRAVAKIKRQAEDQKISLTTTAAANLPQVSGDVAQLATVLECVLQNSLDAMEQGGTVQVVAELGAHSSVQIVITDNGGGMSDEQRQHIFEPFYSGRDAGRGLGMGLSKAWRIVQNHGGEILVQNGAVGTVVTIRLPALAANGEQRVCA